MKEYKYKYLTEALSKEIDELWDNGHAEALTAFGYECAHAYMKGYEKSLVIGAAIGIIGGIVVSTVRVIREKRASEHETSELDKHDEDINKEPTE